MRKLQILLLLFALSPTPYALAQEYGWQDISDNIPDFPYDTVYNNSGDTIVALLTDVYFINDNEGWITTWHPRNDSAAVLHTTDGGETFEVQITQFPCNAIHILNENEGYAGGKSGRVYHTTNGGDNWIAIGSIGTTLLDISFPFDAGPNNPIGYASGDNGTVYSITPQGVLNLNSQLVITLGGISAPSDSNVWVCGGNRIYYYNGTDFTSQFAPTGTFNDIHFINNQEGWVVGNGGIIGYTTDGGANWDTQANPDNQNRSLYGVFFLDANNGWAVSNGGLILHTTNGGTNWLIEGEGLSTAFLNGVHFTSPTNGYVVGNEKTLLKYTEVSGVGESEPMQFKIYPNPARKKFGVRSLEFVVNSGTLEIYDLNGRKLIEEQIPKGSETIEIDVSSLESGVYFCRLISENKSSTQKLIIQK
ncbi:MAG: hypothetical protein CVU43_17575 [Chloroflexi bacterium HGW-Chloroflexi-5]|jgi:photosystem II stability/assembly factor-like uncharacterized protein|nr:MAG: hypothetical protein CVU43_17575 [Chloroflexi bacterium HGW-Chloroflexi-5]